MGHEQLAHDYISAFVRDSLRINASAWIVTNVMRIWMGHGVEPAGVLAALDEVAAEHPLDPERIELYRQAVLDVLSGQAEPAPIPTQRAGEPETHEVAIHCRVCDETLQLDNDEAVLVGNVASFTSSHAECPPFAVRTRSRL